MPILGSILTSNSNFVPTTSLTEDYTLKATDKRIEASLLVSSKTLTLATITSAFKNKDSIDCSSSFIRLGVDEERDLKDSYADKLIAKNLVEIAT